MTKRQRALKRNKRVLFWTKLFLETKSLNAVVTLFYLKRGLGLDQVFYLLVLWGFVTLVFEIPSGYLADIVGRKKTIILGILIHFVGTSLLYRSFNFYMFAASFMLQALAFTFFTGTDSALLYDSLRELGDEKGSTRVSGKYFSANRFTKIFVPTIGAFIAKDLLDSQFNILITIDLVGTAISFVVANFLIEPDRKVDVSESEEGIFKDSLKLFIKDKATRKFVFNQSLVFVATLIFWRLYQPILKDAGLGVAVLGLFYASFQLVTFLANWYFVKLEERFGKQKIILYPVVLGLVCFLVFLVTNNKWLLATASIPILVLGTVRDPLFFEQINLRAKSFNRATTTSVLNLIKNVLGIPVLFLSGLSVKTGTNFGMILGMALIVITLVFFNINKADYIKK